MLMTVFWGEIACLQCGGDGNWGKFVPEIVGA
jgi:hypothetical protein